MRKVLKAIAYFIYRKKYLNHRRCFQCYFRAAVLCDRVPNFCSICICENVYFSKFVVNYMLNKNV